MPTLDAPTLDDLLSKAKSAQRQGNWAEARRLFTDVLERDENNADALHVLGVLDYQDGNLTLACDRVEKASQLKPDTPDILNNLGTVYLGQKRFADSLRVYSRAVELMPTNDAFCTNLAVALNQTGQYEKAIHLMHRVLDRTPEQAGALNALGNSLRLAKRNDEAEKVFRRLVAKTPQEADAHYNLGVSLQDAWHLEEALACYDRAISLDDKQARYHVNRGAALLKLHRIHEAEQAYRRGIELAPMLAEAHYNLAICRFLLGDLADGAAHYQWRLQVDETALSSPRKIDKPMWDGTIALDKTILLHSEQGLGDMVQFVRFIRAVHAMVGKVIVEVQAPLVPMLRDSFAGLTVIARGEPVPVFDEHAPLMSLPHVLTMTLDDLPASPIPYLKAQPERVEKWAQKLATHNKTGKKIGLVWQGNPKAKVERGRSIPLALFEPLLRLPNLRFISLQKDDGLEQVEKLPPALRERVELLGADFGVGEDGFRDALAVIENCDLVISVDSALAHVAGALGKPVWTMIKYTPDWRWMLNRTDTPWYPTMRLFRQKKDGDWAGVLNDVALALNDNPLDAALAAHSQGKLDEAESGYRRVLDDEPDNTIARHHLGVIAYQRKAYDVAETHIRAALSQEPESVDILANLALVVKAQGHLEEAVVLCRRILARAPNHYAAQNNIANLLRSLGQTEEALPHYRAAVALQPQNASLHHNLGLALHDLERLDEASAPLREAVRLAPNNPDFHFDYARTLLMKGAWQEGWTEYEWRRQMHEFGAVSALAQPRWDGTAQPNATLLIHAEQGLGDTFQFLRFVEQARARVGHVLLVVPPAVKTLAATAKGVDAIYAYGEGIPAFDVQIPLMSLPLLFGTTLETLPRAVPYLSAPASRVAHWQKWKAQQKGIVVGLSWQGNPKARADVGRSLHLAQLACLADVQGVTFVALQKGEALAQEGLPLIRPALQDDFADTAALMSVCDVILTTDTSVAHLAGALGKPTYVMLKYAPDWRWMTQRTDCPWYPTQKLFRQPRAGDWESVIHAVKAALITTQNPDGSYHRAVTLHQEGKLEEAVEAYQQVLTVEPNHPLAQMYLAWHFISKNALTKPKRFCEA